MQMRIIVVLSFIAVCTLLDSPALGKSISSLNEINEIVVDGYRRSYIIHKPANAHINNLPLMVVLHGGLGNAVSIMNSTGMNAIADTGPFLVAYPNGIAGFRRNRRTWNAGICCGPASRKKVDDIAFIEKMIEEIKAKYAINPNRVYIAGMSNGAMMTYRLACEIPHKIAAIITVAGTISVDNCDAARDIPVLHIHGMEDQNVPIHGGKGLRSVSGVSHRSLSDTVDLISRSRKCQTPEVIHQKDGSEIHSYHCKKGAPLKLILLKGCGHEWPGGHGTVRKDSVCRNFSASKEAWEFAKQFSKTSE